MTSSPKTEFEVFNQDDYQGYTFYYCDNNHPFIVFTTCYCLACDGKEGIKRLEKEISDLGKELDTIENNYYSLVDNALKTNPELLI
jgi:hypothetical protein